MSKCLSNSDLSFDDQAAELSNDVIITRQIKAYDLSSLVSFPLITTKLSEYTWVFYRRMPHFDAEN